MTIPVSQYSTTECLDNLSPYALDPVIRYILSSRLVVASITHTPLTISQTLNLCPTLLDNSQEVRGSRFPQRLVLPKLGRRWALILQFDWDGVRLVHMFQYSRTHCMSSNLPRR